MKRRLNNWFKFIFVKYVPGSQQIAALEANRLSKFIVENYDLNQQLIILDELKDNIIEFRKNQIIQQELKIEEEIKFKNQLKTNLDKLIIE